MNNFHVNEPDERQGGGGGNLVPANRFAIAQRNPDGALADYQSGPGEAQEGFGLGLAEYWRIFLKRKWLILGIITAFVVLSAVRTLMEIPLYTATARLQIDRTAAKVFNVEGVMPGDTMGWDPEFMRTQYMVLESRALAERVVAALKLGENSSFLQSRGISPLGAMTQFLSSQQEDSKKPVDHAALKSAAVGRVLSHRSIQPVSGSRLVDISYSDPHPQRAQQIANQYAQAFLNANLDKRFEATASAKAFLEDKIQELKQRLEQSEEKMLAFARAQQIVETKEQTSIAESNLAEANTALGTLISERTKNEQLWRQLEKADAINLPQLLTNTAIDTLRSKRKELVINYQQNLETYKPEYPAMVQIKNQIDEIDRQLAGEVEAIRGSLKGAYEASLAQENEMKQRIEELRKEVLDLQGRSIQYNILKREVDTNRELYTALLQRSREVDVSSGGVASNVFIVDSAALPGFPSSPRLKRALMIALAMGLAFGCGAAYVLERLDDKVRSVEQLEFVSGLTSLGAIPKVPRIKEKLADPRSSICEAYRSLCTALEFSTENGVPKSLTITSAGASEGKSVTSLAIARHFASLGRKVLLVDADLRNPSLHLKLECDNSVGLSNYLTGGCTPPEVMQTTSLPNLAFIASGPLPPNAADLLGSARIFSLVSIGSEIFDLIVIDGPPILGLADAQLLSSATSATIFVVAAGASRIGFIRGALKRLQLSRASVIGAVLTSYEAKMGSYGYGYGYGAYYGESSGRPTAGSRKTAMSEIPALEEQRL